MVDSRYEEEPGPSPAAELRARSRERALTYANGGTKPADLRCVLRDATGSGIFKEGRKPAPNAETEARRYTSDRLEGRIRAGIRAMFADGAPVNGEMAALRERIYAALWVIEDRKRKKK